MMLEEQVGIPNWMIADLVDWLAPPTHDIVIVIIHSLCEYRAATIPVDRLHHFMSYLLINIWWDWFFVPRSMCKINLVSEHTADQRSISQKQDFWQISPWNLSNSSKIQHCTRSQGLPLNTPSKELVDQACLIDYAGCDESLECAGCPTLRCLFFFDLQVLTSTTSNGLINPSSHPIHKLFRMEVEDVYISEEMRSLWGVYWTWKRVLWEW